MFLDEAIARYLRHLELANRSPNTVRAAGEDLGLFREWVDRRHNGPVEAGEVTEDDVASYLLHLTDTGRTPAARRRRLISIRAMYGYLIKRGTVLCSPAEVGELCGLRFANVDFTRRAVRVLGKGRKERVVPLNNAAASALAWYVAEVRPQGGGLRRHRGPR